MAFSSKFHNVLGAVITQTKTSGLASCVAGNSPPPNTVNERDDFYGLFFPDAAYSVSQAL